jgi:dihydroorotase-like cyclic amidohydrolase
MSTTRLPLLIDIHRHLRDFEEEHKGTFKTETAAALASGFGTVFAMPNTKPSIITVETLLEARSRAAREGIYCDVAFHFGTNGRNRSQFRRIPKGLVRGLKVYLAETHGGLNIQPNPKLINILLKRWPGVVMFHSPGEDLLNKIVRAVIEGPGASRIANRNRIHICHVSTADEVNLLRTVKTINIFRHLTAEVCPHHLIFTEADLPQLGAYGIMKPPLATKVDQEELWAGVKDRTIDIIATDHAPHSTADKEAGAFGVISEPTFPVIWEAFRQRGFSIEDLVRMMHGRPAEIFDIYPDPDSYMEVDLSDRFVFERSMIHSKAGRSPYEGMRVRGRIIDAYLHGTQVIRGGEILEGIKAGRVI